jgi:GAG-pre-integrase domain
MKLSIQKSHTSPSKNHTATPLTFVRCKPSLSWEMWHQHFEHVAYSGLSKLLDKKLVDGFHVDKHTPTPDCVACTEAKQHSSHFPRCQTGIQNMENSHALIYGEDTPSNQSITTNIMYSWLSLVDDAKWYATVEFVKEKSNAAQGVINYLAHPRMQG